jgi:CheY-like chemotaxis protein
MLRPLIGETIELVTRFDPNLGRVQADVNQIEQVILNLAVNAKDAMPAGGTLTIEARNVRLSETYAREHPELLAGPYVELAVCDTGCGMDERTKGLIFEPFFTTQDTGKGTGLGLATVYGIVKQSGGQVEVISRPGWGSIFRVYLPQVSEAALPRPAETVSPAPRGLETVLLVEDESAVRSFAHLVLQAQGYTVLEAKDAEEALRLARSHTGPLHALVTDVVMPHMSGKQLAERLRAIRPDLKILYVSGYTADPGGDEMTLLQKPFTPAALARKVREVLGGPPG